MGMNMATNNMRVFLLAVALERASSSVAASPASVATAAPAVAAAPTLTLSTLARMSNSSFSQVLSVCFAY